MRNNAEVPADRSRWVVGELPFFFRHLSVPSNASYGLPDRLPFALEECGASGSIHQLFDKTVAAALDKAYRAGSTLSGAMDEQGLGRQYAMDFVRHVQAVVPDIQGRRILEIGCGSGYLLSLLRERGGAVVGIEPGPQGAAAFDRFGVRVIQDFFPSAEVQDLFDVIVAYGVLEHLSNPWAFLRDVRNQLAPRGVAVLAVPDCEPYLLSGDLSCLIHEHWSYFTAGSLRRVVEGAGLSAEVVPAGFGGCLYCVARPDGAASGFSQPGPRGQLSTYRRHSFHVLQRLEAVLRGALERGQDVGFYAAGRMLNALALLGEPVTGMPGIRFFDDNDRLHRMYYPGWPIPIENGADYERRPPDLTIIASRSFGQQIRTRLLKSHPCGRMVDWNDLCSAT